MMEIMQHDGPARLGKYNGVMTPDILSSSANLEIVKDEPMPYNVPKELAKWSVDRTIEFAENSDNEGMAVIHGGKYTDLRVKCARKLDELGYRTLLIANSEALLKNPRDLLNIIVNIRKTVSPNAAIYFPFTDLNFIPLLSYIGVDFFGEFTAEYYAYLNTMLTPDAKYDLEKYRIFDLDFYKLMEYNKNSLNFVVREIRENIKNGTLRNLVEARCCSSPEAMSALRLLDKNHSKFLDRFTPLY
ncbi:MAG: archaeosine tRNA-ribosyltransferase [Methanobacterium sp.]